VLNVKVIIGIEWRVKMQSRHPVDILKEILELENESEVKSK